MLILDGACQPQRPLSIRFCVWRITEDLETGLEWIDTEHTCSEGSGR